MKWASTPEESISYGLRRLIAALRSQSTPGHRASPHFPLDTHILMRYIYPELTCNQRPDHNSGLFLLYLCITMSHKRSSGPADIPYRNLSGARIPEAQGPDYTSSRGPSSPMVESLKIFFACIVAAILYGVLHDQITARVC